MNRTIKFRAWDYEDKKMINWHPDFFYDTSPVTGYSGSFDMIEMPLMQYTGLVDNNNKEIYEGDIVNVNSFGGTPRYEKVAFYTNAGFAGIHPFTDSGHHWSSKNCEIIGNIYENPELLNS
jgi:uncharacterized phage protein (TIGR01671 family)